MNNEQVFLANQISCQVNIANYALFVTLKTISRKSSNDICISCSHPPLSSSCRVIFQVFMSADTLPSDIICIIFTAILVYNFKR